MNLLAKRKEREQAYKAEAFQRYKLYLKHFYSIFHFTTLRLEKNQSAQRALSFTRYRLGVKVLKAFVFNTLKQRKVNNARAFYHSKLCSLALISLYTFLKQRQGRAGLKSKMMRLL